MNVARLLETLELLLDAESEFLIHKKLAAVQRELNNIVSAPQETTHQTNFSEALSELGSALGRMRLLFRPAQDELFEEIGAKDYFVRDLAGGIEERVRENPITPAVAQTHVNELIASRASYVTQITQLRDNLHAVGVKSTALSEGEAEIGFQLPRKLFNNEFEQMVAELNRLRHVINEFSQIDTGRSEEIEVRQISTSDPILFFGMEPTTIALIGGAITWALNTLKQIEEIRLLRAQTKKTMGNPKAILKEYDKAIKSAIDGAVKSKCTELDKIADDNGHTRTPAERKAHIERAVRSILALVDNGVTVDIRVELPDPDEIEEDDTPEGDAEQRAVFGELNDLAKAIKFERSDREPVVPLLPPEQDIED